MRVELLAWSSQDSAGASSMWTWTFGLRDDVEVVLAEIGRDHLRHERLDLGDRLVLDARIDRHRAGRHAGAAADDHDALRRLRGTQRGEVAEHALQPHVLRLARRLHLAGVVVVEHAVRQLATPRPTHHPFALVDDLVGWPTRVAA